MKRYFVAFTGFKNEVICMSLFAENAKEAKVDAVHFARKYGDWRHNKHSVEVVPYTKSNLPYIYSH